jgi:hypothetical protein
MKREKAKKITPQEALRTSKFTINDGQMLRKVIDAGAVEMILELFLIEEKKKILKKVEELAIQEMLICYEEGTPTSRLTSLIMKLKEV